MPAKDIYHDCVKNALIKSDRLLYLAVTEAVFTAIFTEDIGKIFLDDNTIRLLVFDSQQEVITRWIN